jgi:triphosphoribosyl-dephospho-CoA synthetase
MTSFSEQMRAFVAEVCAEGDATNERFYAFRDATENLELIEEERVMRENVLRSVNALMWVNLTLVRAQLDEKTAKETREKKERLLRELRGISGLQ